VVRAHPTVPQNQPVSAVPRLFDSSGYRFWVMPDTLAKACLAHPSYFRLHSTEHAP
jgi:hypothetical protein